MAVSLAESAAPKLRVRTVRRQNAQFRLGIDLGQKNATFVARTMTLRKYINWTQAFAIAPEPGYDLLHTVNAVPLLTRRPYLIQFENFLPRVPEDTYIGWLEHSLQRRLLKDVRRGRCLALLAMSHFGRRQFHKQNEYFTGRDEIERKVEVLYPSIDYAADPKPHSQRLKLVFVGFNFMGKGGPASCAHTSSSVVTVFPSTRTSSRRSPGHATISSDLLLRHTSSGNFADSLLRA